MTHKNKWLLFAPAGLVTIGFGSCLVQWAAEMKQDDKPTRHWVAAGTVALGVFNAGVSLFGRGVVEKVLHEVREKGPSARIVGIIEQAADEE